MKTTESSTQIFTSPNRAARKRMNADADTYTKLHPVEKQDTVTLGNRYWADSDRKQTSTRSRAPKHEPTRREKLTRRLLLPAGVVLTGLAAGVAIEASPSGQAPLPKDATVALGTLLLNEGVNLHSSPDMDMSADLSASPVSTNVTETVGANRAISVHDPIVVQKPDNLGNNTVWYGFENTSKGNAMEWVNATDVSNEQPRNGANYIDFHATGPQAENFQITSPQDGSEAPANLNTKTGQYEVKGQPVAIGNEIPASKANISF